MGNSRIKPDTWLKRQIDLSASIKEAEKDFQKHRDYYIRKDAIETILENHAQVEYSHVNEERARKRVLS